MPKRLSDTAALTAAPDPICFTRPITNGELRSSYKEGRFIETFIPAEGEVPAENPFRSAIQTLKGK